MSFSRTNMDPLPATAANGLGRDALSFSIPVPLTTDEVPKLLRNGTEPVRLSIRALAGALFKVYGEEWLNSTMPVDCCEWLEKQVHETFKAEWIRQEAEKQGT